MRVRQDIQPHLLPSLGYMKFVADSFGEAKTLWQKRVTVGSQTRYFIDLYQYDFSGWNILSYDVAFEVNLSFNTEDFGNIQVVVLLDASDNVSSVERKAEGLFQALHAKNYE